MLGAVAVSARRGLSLVSAMVGTCLAAVIAVPLLSATATSTRGLDHVARALVVDQITENLLERVLREPASVLAALVSAPRPAAELALFASEDALRQDLEQAQLAGILVTITCEALGGAAVGVVVEARDPDPRSHIAGRAAGVAVR